MQVPPPGQYGASPAPKSNTKLIVIIVLAVVFGGGCLFIAIMAAILFPVFSQAKLAAKETKSLSNIKQLNTALLIYCVEADDHYPLAKNWGDALGDRTPADVFHDPVLGMVSERPFGYAMNEAASGASSAAIAHPEKTVLLYTSRQADKNASGSKGDLRPTKQGNVRVGFANGAAKKMKTEDAAKLDWEIPR